MKIFRFLSAALTLSILFSACSTYNSRVSDAGREVRNENGYTTLQQSIRF